MQDVLDRGRFSRRVMTTMQAKADLMARAYDQDVDSLELSASVTSRRRIVTSLRGRYMNMLVWKAVREKRRFCSRRAGHHARLGSR
jgi:hypothetical protein